MRKFLVIIFLSVLGNGYTQTHNFWTKKNDFGGLKRERAVAFTANDFAFVGTGIDTAEHVLNDFWKYDAMTDSWEQVANLPGSIRRNAVAFSINDIGYVGTGMDSAVASVPGSNVLSDFWAYDPVLNSWTQKADFPGSGGNGVYFATGFSIDSKGYICCGKRGPNDYTDELWEYKPSIDQWAQLPSFPGGVRYQLSSFSIGYSAFVGLGTDQDLYRNDIWKFDATINQWTEMSNFPASERAGATSFTIGERGYICMGTNGGMLDDLWEYNPISDLWSVKANYGGSARKNAVAFSLHGKGYVGTGKGYSGKKMSFHEYTPSDILSIENNGEIELSIYPNPVTDVITIQTTNPITKVDVLNTNGKLCKTTSNCSILVSDLEPGIYLLHVWKDNNLVSSKRIVKV